MRAGEGAAEPPNWEDLGPKSSRAEVDMPYLMKDPIGTTIHEEVIVLHTTSVPPIGAVTSTRTNRLRITHVSIGGSR